MHGLRWEIERADLLRYLEAQQRGHNIIHQRVDRPQPVDAQPFLQHGHSIRASSPPMPDELNHGQHVAVENKVVDGGRVDPAPQGDPRQQPLQAVVPLAAHLAALELANGQLDRLQHQVDVERERWQKTEEIVEHERRRADQAERARLALEWQLQKYQTALSEQAESLAEALALRKVAESQLAQQQPPPEELPVESLSVEKLKTGRQKKSWSQRIRGLFRLSQAE